MKDEIDFSKPFVVVPPLRPGEMVHVSNCSYRMHAFGVQRLHLAGCEHDGKQGTIEELAQSDWPDNKKS